MTKVSGSILRALNVTLQLLSEKHHNLADVSTVLNRQNTPEGFVTQKNNSMSVTALGFRPDIFVTGIYCLLLLKV